MGNKHGFLILIGFSMVAATAVSAAPPCDFKGLSVGDKATPQQIMKHFGVEKFANADAELPKEQREAAFNARIERAKKVGLTNAAEEEQWKQGSACGNNFCIIPFGVTVGNGSFPISVGVFVSFDKSGIIQAIDLSWDRTQWDDVMVLLNNKYGDNWAVEEMQDVTTDYETKKSQPDTVTLIKHRTFGRNSKTGDNCSINASTRDMVWLHTTPPIYRASMEIRLISKNF
jgi:hypothetical protein